MKLVYKRCKQILVVVVMTSAFAAQVHSQSLKTLVISGFIGGAKNPLTLSLADLQQLPQQRYTTTNPWVKEPRTYQGPLLSDVLKLAKAKSSRITLVALNDYHVNMNFAPLEKFKPILAWSENGKRMTIPRRGPLWVMFPVDKYPQLKNQRYNSYMIWQLHKIIVNE